MKNRIAASGAIRLCLLALLLTLSLAPSAAAQPADNCSGTFAVPGGLIPPNDFTGTPLASPAADIDMTTGGCDNGNGQGVGDVVMCFTPLDTAGNCTATITCTLSTGGNVDMGISTSGASCADSGPAPSCAAAFSDNPTASSGAFPLTSGTEYCVYCQRRSGGGVYTLNTAITSDCDTLPVDLFEFSIESSTAEGPLSAYHEPGAGAAD